MKLIIDIPEDAYVGIISSGYFSSEFNMIKALKESTPLDKHDEEIIAETVESIWGKPPYTELLDKIRTEIEEIAFDWQEIDGEHESFMVVDLNDVFQIIDKYRTGNEVSE